MLPSSQLGNNEADLSQVTYWKVVTAGALETRTTLGVDADGRRKGNQDFAFYLD